jgi:predicted O-methyltransferase YrrM
VRTFGTNGERYSTGRSGREGFFRRANGLKALLVKTGGSMTSETIVQQTLQRAFPGKSLKAEHAFTRAGMSPEELVRLHELVLNNNCTNVLEIGMGSGTSSVVMLAALETLGGRLTSVDPFQSSSFNRAGQQRVEQLGHGERHRLIEKPDYIAMPELTVAGERFDMVLVDGYHSFDYTLVDMFFADLLLRPSGILAMHDSSWPAVLKSIQFFEAHKDYTRLSPAPLVRRNGLFQKAAGRLGIYAGGMQSVRAFNDRRHRWHTLAAYRKVSDRMAPEFDARF